MRFGRHKTCKRVILKIVFVWCLSLACSLPLSLMYAADSESTIVHGSCQIPTSLFQIIGSVICFYIPLIIMIVTYALTVRLLSVQKMQLLNGGSDRGSKNSTNFTTKNKPKKRVRKQTSMTEVPEGKSVEDYTTESRKPRNNHSSPYRIDSNKCYKAVETKSPRRAQLRVRKNSSRTTIQSNIPSVELTVFNPKIKCEASQSSMEIYTKSSPLDFDRDEVNAVANLPEEEILTVYPSSPSLNNRYDQSTSLQTDVVIVDDQIQIETCDEPKNYDGNPVNVPCSCAPR